MNQSLVSSKKRKLWIIENTIDSEKSFIASNREQPKDGVMGRELATTHTYHQYSAELFSEFWAIILTKSNKL